jgi:hypothetical protein
MLDPARRGYYRKLLADVVLDHLTAR